MKKPHSILPSDFMVVVTHPRFSDTYVMRKTKLKRFLEINASTWKKHNIDADDFVIQKAFLKDREIEALLLEEFPEYIL